MLFSNNLDKVIYVILKKDKNRRDNILKLLNMMPSNMYHEIQNILELYEDEDDTCAIRELETNEFVVDNNILNARYIVGHDLLIESIGDLSIALHLNKKEATYSDKHSYITYEIERDKIIRWNFDKKYIIPIVKKYYVGNKEKDLTLKYVNNKFNN